MKSVALKKIKPVQKRKSGRMRLPASGREQAAGGMGGGTGEDQLFWRSGQEGGGTTKSRWRYVAAPVLTKSGWVKAPGNQQNMQKVESPTAKAVVSFSFDKRLESPPCKGKPAVFPAAYLFFRFQSREWDDALGMYYYRARMYLPDIGRFVQVDPKGMVDGPNLYTFEGNSPVNNVDPYGSNDYPVVGLLKAYWTIWDSDDYAITIDLQVIKDVVDELLKDVTNCFQDFKWGVIKCAAYAIAEIVISEGSGVALAYEHLISCVTDEIYEFEFCLWKSFNKFKVNLQDAFNIDLLGGLYADKSLKQWITDRKSDPKKDTDGDGLTDVEEESLGTEPDDTDTDDDSLRDGDEVIHGTDPTKFDTDGDSLSDNVEIKKYNTNPSDSDTDNDGILDGNEQGYGTSPTDPDSDNDYLTDGEEITGDYYYTKETIGGGTNPYRERPRYSISGGSDSHLDIELSKSKAGYGSYVDMTVKGQNQQTPFSPTYGAIPPESIKMIRPSLGWSLKTDPTNSHSDDDIFDDYVEIWYTKTNPNSPFGTELETFISDNFGIDEVNKRTWEYNDYLREVVIDYLDTLNLPELNNDYDPIGVEPIVDAGRYAIDNKDNLVTPSIGYRNDLIYIPSGDEDWLINTRFGQIEI